MKKKTYWNPFLGREVPTEPDFGPPFTHEVWLTRGVRARTLSLEVTVDLSSRPAELPRHEGMFNPGEPHEQLSALLSAWFPGFFGWSGEERGEVRLLRTSETSGRREVALEVSLPAMHEDGALALVHALGARRILQGVTHVLAREGDKTARQREELTPKTRLAKVPFELDDHFTAAIETFSARIELEEDISDETRASLERLSHGYAALLAHGALASDVTEASNGRLERAEDILPNEWSIAIEDYRGSRAAWEPLLAGLSWLHERAPIRVVEIWG